MPTDLTALTDAVQNVENVHDSVLKVFQMLGADLTAAVNLASSDPAAANAAVQAVADRLNNDAATLAGAVVANTPADTSGTGSSLPPADQQPAPTPEQVSTPTSTEPPAAV